MHRLSLLLFAMLLFACSQAAPLTPSPTSLASLPPPQITQASSTAAPLPTDTPAPSPTATATSQPPTLTSTPAPAITGFPNPDAFTWRLVSSELRSPLGIANDGDPQRLYVVEQAGRIRLIENGQLQPQPFLDIRDRISAGGERGLLGLAFHPRFPENGYFYVNYTDLDGNTVIARYSANPEDPSQADPESEQRLFHINQPYPNHNGGALAFGPDGYLYIGLGDGGSQGDPHGNGQSLNAFLGKILRVDVNSPAGYSIPPDNPFAGGSGKPEIWAYGLRNPWRISFDRQTGDLFIGDVGQNTFEEVDVQPGTSHGGENYGWNIMEGFSCYRQNNCNQAGLTLPVHDYSHQNGRCSISGGVVVRDPSLPEWQGIYLFGDYCSGEVGGLFPAKDSSGQPSWNPAWLFSGLGSISSFGEGASGEIYLADLNGNIYQLARK